MKSKRFFSQDLCRIFCGSLIFVLGSVLFFIVLNLPRKEGDENFFIIWIIIGIFVIAYILWLIIPSLEFTSFNDKGITIKSPIVKIEIKWSEILAITIDKRICMKTTRGGPIENYWIIIKTEDKLEPNVVNLNKKNRGFYYILARNKIFYEMRKYLIKYRHDLVWMKPPEMVIKRR